MRIHAIHSKMTQAEYIRILMAKQNLEEYEILNSSFYKKVFGDYVPLERLTTFQRSQLIHSLKWRLI